MVSCTLIPVASITTRAMPNRTMKANTNAAIWACSAVTFGNCPLTDSATGERAYAATMKVTSQPPSARS
jgi:hypothetical protein